MRDFGLLNATDFRAIVCDLIKTGQSFKFVDKNTLKIFTVNVTMEEPEVIQKEDGSKWQRIG